MHTHTLTSFVSLFAISVHSASSYFTNKFSLTGTKLITRPGELNATDDFVTMASPAGHHRVMAFTSHLPTLCSPHTISIATASPMAAVSSIPHKLLRNSFRHMKNWPIFQTPSVTHRISLNPCKPWHGGPIPQLTGFTGSEHQQFLKRQMFLPKSMETKKGGKGTIKRFKGNKRPCSVVRKSWNSLFQQCF